MFFKKKKDKNEKKARNVHILVVCGCGVGSSVMLKGVVEDVLAKHNIRAKMEVSDMLKAPSLTADVLICAPEIKRAMKNVDKNFRKIVLIDNFLSNEEIESKLLPAIDELNKDVL